MNNVAVYGTLKRDFGNHHLIQQHEDSTFLGTHVVPAGRFAMFSLGGFPAIVEKDECNYSSPINIEVFRVNDRALRSLDGLEGHPDWYRRKEIETPFGSAWVYVMPYSKIDGRGLELVPNGEWKRFQRSMFG